MCVSMYIHDFMFTIYTVTDFLYNIFCINLLVLYHVLHVLLSMKDFSNQLPMSCALYAFESYNYFL